MALPQDLEKIARATRRAQAIMLAAQQLTVQLTPTLDDEDDTTITLTNAQRNEILQKLAPQLAIIKSTAATLN